MHVMDNTINSKWLARLLDSGRSLPGAKDQKLSGATGAEVRRERFLDGMGTVAGGLYRTRADVDL